MEFVSAMPIEQADQTVKDAVSEAVAQGANVAPDKVDTDAQPASTKFKSTIRFETAEAARQSQTALSEGIFQDETTLTAALTATFIANNISATPTVEQITEAPTVVVSGGPPPPQAPPTETSEGFPTWATVVLVVLSVTGVAGIIIVTMIMRARRGGTNGAKYGSTSTGSQQGALGTDNDAV